MERFKASEIFQIAVKIEENGEKFYRHASNIATDEKTKEMFNFLADEEVKHKRTFEGMASSLEKYEPPESYPGEYFAYLHAYAENLIFPPDKLQEKFDKIKDVGAAIDFAIQRELESILYYLEAKNLVPESQKGNIDKIVDEERRHYLKLSEIKKGLS